jgi:hypothetical protein
MIALCGVPRNWGSENGGTRRSGDSTKMGFAGPQS